MDPRFSCPGIVRAARDLLIAQTAILVAFALSGRRLARRVEALEEELRTEITGSLASLRRVVANAEEVSDPIARGFPELEAAIEGTAENVRRANDLLETLEWVVMRPLRPIARGLALWRGIRKGLRAWKEPSLLNPGPRA